MEILQETWHATHFLKLLDKMCKYEMDPTRTVGATERTSGAGRTRDGRTDGRSETNIPPNNFVVYNNGTEEIGLVTPTPWVTQFDFMNISHAQMCWGNNLIEKDRILNT